MDEIKQSQPTVATRRPHGTGLSAWILFHSFSIRLTIVPWHAAMQGTGEMPSGKAARLGCNRLLGSQPRPHGPPSQVQSLSG